MQNLVQRQLCFLRTACVLAALIISAAIHAADITYETRALTGTDGPLGPGLGDGVNFSDFFSPLLNEAGQTAFWVGLTGAGVTIANDRGIWSEAGGEGLALVARTGNQTPGTPDGVNFSFLESAALNSAGQTAFSATLTGTGVTSENNSGIWSEGGGSGLALVARTGSQAPGTDPGVNFRSLDSTPKLNDAGQMAFRGGLTGTGVTSANDFGIWSEGGGSGLALIAREGDNAPGTTNGVNFSFLINPELNGAGQTAFRGELTGPGVTDANTSGIWSEGGGSGLALVARSGDPAPGTPDGVNFGNFSDPVLNGAGQIAFRGGLTGTGVTQANDGGIWFEGGELGLALIAREGDNAPGTPNGVNFSHFSAPVLNGAGQTAFTGSLTGSVNSSNDRGIWATAPDGQLHLIARTGDLFNVSNDPLTPDPRTIRSLSLTASSAGQAARQTVFNDAGQLAFSAGFTDGSSGIFVATIAALFKITITPAIAPATGFDFTWYSHPGKVYDLVTSTDLVTPVSKWPVHAAYSDIPATGTTTTLTAVPVDEPQRFFAVIEKDAPQVSSDD